MLCKALPENLQRDLHGSRVHRWYHNKLIWSRCAYASRNGGTTGGHHPFGSACRTEHFTCGRWHWIAFSYRPANDVIFVCQSDGFKVILFFFYYIDALCEWVHTNPGIIDSMKIILLIHRAHTKWSEISLVIAGLLLMVGSRFLFVWDLVMPELVRLIRLCVCLWYMTKMLLKLLLHTRKHNSHPNDSAKLLFVCYRVMWFDVWYFGDGLVAFRFTTICIWMASVRKVLPNAVDLGHIDDGLCFFGR